MSETTSTGFFRTMHAENQLAINRLADRVESVREKVDDLKETMAAHSADDARQFAELKAGNETSLKRMDTHKAEHIRVSRSAWGPKEWTAFVLALATGVTGVVKLFKVGDVQEKQVQVQQDAVKKIDELKPDPKGGTK